MKDPHGLQRTDDPRRHGKACESCRAWEPVANVRQKGDITTAGVCRRLPPVVGSWPRTLANDWCWDYIPASSFWPKPDETT